MKKRIITICLLAMSSIASATSIPAEQIGDKKLNSNINNQTVKVFCVFENSIYSEGSKIKRDENKFTCARHESGDLYWKDGRVF
ncbi:MAG: YnjH family protein [gamma proteobacterium symbiont of Lucinoma myriamae]|nr:YnjH family protein [gamma proteobacterium symbiont of Lucinoma myriamae]